MKSRLSLFAAGLGLALAGCAAPPARDQASAPPAPASARHTTAELMAILHHQHDKLGYSIAASNRPLAKFYLDKVKETLAAADELDAVDGMPVSTMIPAMMASSVNVLAPQLEAGDWPRAQETYRAMTMACNSCHASTRREFVIILPAEGKPPYNQQF